MDFPDIPEFLRIPQEQRDASWRGRRLTKIKSTSVTRLKVEDPSTRAFRRELERQRKAKDAARFKILREREFERRRGRMK